MPDRSFLVFFFPLFGLSEMYWAWCLSWWHDEWSGFREATRSHPHEDKHKAPSSTPPHPLSLQDAGRTFPDSVGTIHQEAGPQASQWV